MVHTATHVCKQTVAKTVAKRMRLHLCYKGNYERWRGVEEGKQREGNGEREEEGCLTSAKPKTGLIWAV